VVPIGGHFVQVYVSCVSRLQLTEIYQAPPHSTTPLSQSDIHLLILTSLPKDVKQKHKTQYLQQPKLTINPLNHASKYKKPKAQKGTHQTAYNRYNYNSLPKLTVFEPVKDQPSENTPVTIQNPHHRPHRMSRLIQG
jgi:hypothetical protein